MGKLGINFYSLIWQIVNFSIMLIILTKFLYKPILESLKKRRKEIEEGLRLTENAKKEEEELVKKRLEIVMAARQDAKGILDTAKKEAQKKKEEILESGKKELTAFRMKLDMEMKAREATLTDEISQKTVDIATEMLKQILPKVLDDTLQKEFIKKQFKELEKRYEK